MRRKYRLTENGLRNVVKDVVNEWFGLDIQGDGSGDGQQYSKILYVLFANGSKEPCGIFDSVEAAAKFAADKISKDSGESAEDILNNIKDMGNGFRSSGGYDDKWGFGYEDYNCCACGYYQS